ncbi:DMT family transporter [Terasakiella sp. A23]|uniref:DMT family transporter n=1 Tax=Terasakiella sp. FCG-A23 TaxID=3080561 RepID=UPI002952D074|nr:DMT family transporter [Terasakiella sp. A23]MDV7340492.1 DMT family transporter [Terasakiella sp. A23]
MSKLLENPVSLLLMTGFLLGLYLPLGKIASLNQISPILWAMVVSLGAVVILLPILLKQRRLHLPKRHMLRYVLISGLISYVIPNILLFKVMAYVGSGYMGLMYALSPVFTLGFAVLFAMKTPNMLGIFGITVGLVGAIVVTLTRSTAPDAPEFIWIMAALFVPVSLACGNIYRTLDWPEGATPDMLAFWSHVASVVFFAIILFFKDGSLLLESLNAAPTVTFLQLIVGGLTFPVLFRLQQKGGPVLLSQIGYIAAGVGLVAATVFLGEIYPSATWLGAGIIAIGIAISIISQTQTGKQAPAT